MFSAVKPLYYQSWLRSMVESLCLHYIFHTAVILVMGTKLTGFGFWFVFVFFHYFFMVLVYANILILYLLF